MGLTFVATPRRRVGDLRFLRRRGGRVLALRGAVPSNSPAINRRVDRWESRCFGREVTAKSIA